MTGAGKLNQPLPAVFSLSAYINVTRRPLIEILTLNMNILEQHIYPQKCGYHSYEAKEA